jgi:hypothetical protein
MNHIYRLIWNHVNACWQAVNEVARGNSKSGMCSVSRASQSNRISEMCPEISPSRPLYEKSRLVKGFFIAAIVASLSVDGNAATFNFTGTISSANDVVTVPFTVDTAATNVRVWTDSFQSAANFDPITALWNATTGALLGQNDDNDTINPATQSYYDSGLAFGTLAAGSYFFTIAAFSNFAHGPNITDGFYNDGSFYDYPGRNWSVWLDGISSASEPTVGNTSDITSAGSPHLAAGLAANTLNPVFDGGTLKMDTAGTTYTPGPLHSEVIHVANMPVKFTHKNNRLQSMAYANIL